MKKILIFISLFVLSTVVIGQKAETSHIVINGNLSIHDIEIDSVDFHSFIIDSSNSVISYFWVSELNDYEIYHDFKLVSDISTYQMLISDDKENKGDIEFYVSLNFDAKTTEFRPGMILNLKSVQALDEKEFRRHLKHEPRLRSLFDKDRHKIEIKNVE